MLNNNTSLKGIFSTKSALMRKAISVHWMSSLKSTNSSSSLVAYPQFKVYSPSCMLNIFPTSPIYKKYGTTYGIFVERQGRMMMEFIPAKTQQDGSKTTSNNRASYDYNSKGKIALSVEEIGLFLAKTSSSDNYDSSNDKMLEFKRLGWKSILDDSSNASTMNVYDAQGISTSSNTSRIPERVLTILPEATGSMTFQLAAKSINSGSQDSLNQSSITTLKVSISPGELEVLKCLFRDSIAHLTGWGSMMRYNDNNNMDAALNTQRENYASGTSPRFRTGGPGVEEDLF